MNSSVAIIVEGKSDKCFFKAYLKHLGFGAITDNAKVQDGILLIDSGGVNATFSSFSSELTKICAVRSKVLVIWDANNCSDKRRKDFEQGVQKIAPPKKVNKDIFLFLLPDDSRQGELENLLEDISTKKDIHNCFDEYKGCLKKNPEYCPQSSKETLKVKIYAYCEAMGVETHVEKRDYADKRLWDLDSDKLNALKDFLQSNIQNSPSFAGGTTIQPTSNSGNSAAVSQAT